MDRRTGAVGDTAPGGKENMFRRGKVGDPLRRSERETSGPCEPLQPGEVRDTRCADFRCRWPVVDESLRSGPMRASASTTARAARSEAERAERGAGQMRPCTPTQDAPAPRESAFKPVPHPAAPVGRSSQTRRHHLSSTPVQQLCTDVQSCDQKRFFSYTGRGAFSFWR